MTREEAHALAEREVTEHARKGLLVKHAARRGLGELEQGFSALLGGLPDLERSLRSGRVMTGDIVAMAAVCIEFLRELHLELHNREKSDADSSSIRFYARCRNCAPEKPRKQSLEEWGRLNVELTDSGIQVWCRRCNMEVGHFTPQQLEQQLADARCACCPGGIHVN